MRFGFLLGASLEQIKRTLPLILLLRQPDFSASCSDNQVHCDRDRGSEADCWKAHSQVAEYSTAQDMAVAKANSGLLLYYNEYSFYSQKVVLALYEKNLLFDTHDIDLNGEQYKPWFLQINPRGEVPVLQDTGKIIPDSARIIDYLEDNFSNGHSPRLLPVDKGGELRQKITYFRGIIDKINGNVLTIGSLLHPELATGSKKVPFIAPVRKQLVNADKNSATNLRKYAQDNPDAREMLLEKAENQEKKHEKMQNKEEFVAILKETDKVFDEVEAELAQHADKLNWWLCTDGFTVADVSLTILLVRVNQIGMEPYFWTNGKRPHVERYFIRVQERDSYKKTVPTTFSLVKTIFKTQMPLIIGVSIAAAIALIVGGWFIVKKIMHK
nr:glutathione S-transferase [Dendroctonus rhizophagus]